jgi:membrane-associated phospholipid phosphatase
MRGDTLRRAVRPESPPRLLLPRYRRAAAVLLAACAATVVGLAVYLAVQSRPAWPDPSSDQLIRTVMGHFPALLQWLPGVGTLGPVALMTLALIAACAATRHRAAAVLAGVAEPIAVGLTEYVLKPYVGGAIGQGFPSGHAASMFALAAICTVLLAGPTCSRTIRVVRLPLILLALLLAAAVAAAMVAIGAHTFTDAVGGAAVGTGVVLACALAIDLVTGRAYRAQRARAARSGPDRPAGDRSGRRP